MQLQDFDFNQIIIVLLFLGLLVTLQQLIKRNKFKLQGKFYQKRRIYVVDEVGISPSERVRLLRIDNIEYLYFYTKGNPPVICQHNTDQYPKLVSRKSSTERKLPEISSEDNQLNKSSNVKKTNILSEAISVARKMNPQLGFKK